MKQLLLCVAAVSVVAMGVTRPAVVEHVIAIEQPEQIAEPTPKQQPKPKPDLSTCRSAVLHIFPKSEHTNALKILAKESNGRHDAHNLNHNTRDDSWGCYQINLYGNLAAARPSAEWLVIPENNVRYALDLWRSVGWCSTRGWYNSARAAGLC